MKVAELTGALLDYWVKRAEHPSQDLGGAKHVQVRRDGEDPEKTQIYNHSVPWSVDATYFRRALDAGDFTMEDCWTAYMPISHAVCVARGPTPRIAAARAYVMAKFGETVPDEA